MDFRRQRYFMAVAEHKGFRRAANALNVSQPSLSQQIQMLEEHLGITLIERNNRAIKLTAAGQEYYKGLKTVFSDLDRWVERAREAQAGYRGSLRIGANAMLLMSHLPVIVNAFRTSHPDAHLDLAAVPAPEATGLLRDGEADLVLSGQIAAADDLHTEAFCHFPWRVLLSPSHPLAQRGGAVDLRDLSGETLFIASHFSSLVGHEDVLAIFRDQNVTLGEVRELPGALPVVPIIGLVACGLGFSITSAAYESQFPLVRFLPIANVGRDVRIAAAWRHDNENPLIIQFMEVARRVMTGT